MIEKIIGNQKCGVIFELRDLHLTIRELGDKENFPKEVMLFDEETEELKKFLDENLK